MVFKTLPDTEEYSFIGTNPRPGDRGILLGINGKEQCSAGQSGHGKIGKFVESISRQLVTDEIR